MGRKNKKAADHYPVSSFLVVTYKDTQKDKSHGTKRRNVTAIRNEKKIISITKRTIKMPFETIYLNC